MTDYKNKVMQRRLITKLKRALKKEEPFVSKCKEYGCSPDMIDKVKVTFEPLDVSAKTIDGRIILNEKLFDEGELTDQLRYLCHESIHVLQQNAGKVNEQTAKKDYLDDPNEQEAFQVQLEYMDEHTPEEVQKYLENLLDHHDIQGKERKEKKEVLTEDL